MDFSSSELQNEVNTTVMATVFELLRTSITGKCFDVCVTRPSSSLSGSEQQCLAKCADRYIEALQVVAKAAVEYDNGSGLQ
ncbi:Mitochondrial import inner membrane translocase subunit Tim13 [Porphyridium purpureum]|uniref:Mitochondrial import inner membrane translocase subunit n=1 Tax=Porphyridium purpureum TaxID=35688 RepID=A0A5J4YN84_PORPP|nr:Mitochondrial import inner membrane translocase subunit Tim13 [Porphyridium purpureum]|eukprot:POR7424..scf249_10